METRKTLVTLLTWMGLSASMAYAQNWVNESGYAMPYNGTVTRTTVTNYTPAYPAERYEQPTYPTPGAAQPSYVQPTYAEPAMVQTQYVQPTYSQPSYVAAPYVQPTYAQPVNIPVVYAPTVYAPPAVPVAYTAPVYVTANYAPPAYVARPVMAAYPTTVYRPVMQGCAAPEAPVAVTAVATGPRVYVHPKVYVEGQPIRNLFRAITP